MKKLFFALALLIITTNMAFAASCNPNTDKMTNGQWCITSADTLIPSSSASQQVITELVTAAAAAGANRQMSVGETGKKLVDMGGAAGPTLAGFCGKYTLPQASAGLEYTFSTGTRCAITVDTVSAADTILYSISSAGLAAGSSIKSTGQAGDSVTVTSPGANKWAITQMKAVWTDNGGS